MNRIFSFILLFSVLVFASACSAKKPPEQTVVKSRTILSVLRSLDKAYEAKDREAFLSDVSAAFPDREQFSKTLETVFKKYETIRFTIQYAKMMIFIEEKGRGKATFTWDADWTEAGGSVVKDGGRVTLVFEPSTFKLLSIDGKNPFLAQPGEAPGGKE